MKKNGLLLAFLLAGRLGYAQLPSDPDPTFGNNGIVLTNFNDTAPIYDEMTEMIMQPDGKIIAMGSSMHAPNKLVAIARYNPDGSLDPSFAQGGKRVIEISGDYGNFPAGGGVREDGKIILGGRIFNHLSGKTRTFLLRLNSDGTDDETFGSAGNGVIIHELDGAAVVERIQVQKDHKIVMAGYYNDNIMAVRFNPDGSLDSSFGEDGMSVVKIEGSENASFAFGLDIQEDGKIIMTGMYSALSQWKWATVRLLPDGSPDETFDGDGIRLLSLGGGHDFSIAAKVQKDGKILIAGHSWIANQPYLQYALVVARMLPDGTLDNGFGLNGFFKHSIIESGASYAADLVISPQGNIYVSSSTVKNNNIADVALVALDGKGTLIDSFGNGGIVTVDLDLHDDSAEALLLQPDGKIVLGITSLKETSRFALLRCLTGEPTGTANIIAQTKPVRVYPIPVKDVLHIDADEGCTVEIYDMQGRIVAKDANIRSLNVTNLPAGNYVIKLSQGDRVQALPVVKE